MKIRNMLVGGTYYINKLVGADKEMGYKVGQAVKIIRQIERGLGSDNNGRTFVHWQLSKTKKKAIKKHKDKDG